MTDLGLTAQFMVLRDREMIDMQTDWGCTFAYVEKLTAGGADHYAKVRAARRRFVAVSDQADELADDLYAQAKAQKKSGDALALSYRKGRDEDYRELQRNGLIDVTWADNMPFIVGVTDEGWSYVEGWFLEQEKDMDVIISPTINNNVDTSSTAEANAAASNITLGSTIQQIIDLEIPDEEKEEIEKAIKELDQVAKRKDSAGFLDKLERVANIAKDTSATAKVVVPFIASLAGGFV